MTLGHGDIGGMGIRQQQHVPWTLSQSCHERYQPPSVEHKRACATCQERQMSENGPRSSDPKSHAQARKTPMFKRTPALNVFPLTQTKLASSTAVFTCKALANSCSSRISKHRSKSGSFSGQNKHPLVLMGKTWTQMGDSQIAMISRG